MSWINSQRMYKHVYIVQVRAGLSLSLETTAVPSYIPRDHNITLDT